MTLAMHQVLVVSGAELIRESVHVMLASEGFRCLEASTVAGGETLARERKPDLMLLDLDPPDGEALAMIQRVRRWSPVPIIALSKDATEQRKIAALDAGADDYVGNPFTSSELLARMRAVLRRTVRGLGPSDVLTLGDVRLDFTRREARSRLGNIHLTPLEYRVLECMARHGGFIVPRARLVEEVWGPEHGGDTQSLRVCIKNLRRKLEKDPHRPEHITTEMGLGYRLRAPARSRR